MLAPLSTTFDDILGVVGGDVGRRLPGAAWGHLPVSLGRVKHDCLVAVSALAGDAMWLLECVPEEVATFTLSWALHSARAAHPSLAWQAWRQA
jgi:hypothetical protein